METTAEIKVLPEISQISHKSEVIDLQPPEASSPVPILLIQGWGETPVTHEQTLNTIVNNKRRALTIKFPRRGKMEKAEDYPAVELNKAQSVLAAIDEKGIEKVDVIAHSEGALAAIIAADLEPEKFKNIVFFDPAGLIGKDSTVKLATRFVYMLLKDGARFAKGEGSRKEKIKAALEAVKYFASNPKRSFQEASAMANSDIYDMLGNLRELGIKISVIHGVDDTVFPIKRILSTAQQKGGMDTIGFYSTKGDHREISIHPEKYTALAVNALNDLEKKKES